MRFSTRAIHAGQPPDPSTGAIMTPIYQTSTYVQEAPAKHKGYEYARTGNPTRTALEANLAALESARFGVCFASGCAAANTVMNLLRAGDHVVAGDDLYGGTYRLFTKVFEKYGLTFTFVNTSDLDATARAFRRETRMVWVETPSNPLLRITDLAAVAKLAHDRGALAVADNTFATPYLQRPIELGCDLVVHSTTKYLGGHSDVVGGAVLLNDEELRKQLGFYQNAVGAVPGPMDCFLTLRGTKTLAVRMERHCENAERIARHLAEHPMVAYVNYPGHDRHPGHEIARRQMARFGGMISFELKASLEQSVRFVSSTRVFSLAESLGGVESLIEHPASMTHASIPRELRQKSGLADGLIRLSVGIEDVEDLIEDLERGFAEAKKTS